VKKTRKSKTGQKKVISLPKQRDALRGAESLTAASGLVHNDTPESRLNTEREKRLANALLPLILTPLECDVIEWFLEGFSRKAIAEKLSITVPDVVEVRMSALEKIKEKFPPVLQDYERRLYSLLAEKPRRKLT
jgi:DNA-binding CsgD family transcriptional regulator